jgi:hypothetical protein
MKKSFSILALMFFLCVWGVLAQEKPNLSGTWRLDEKATQSIYRKSPNGATNYVLKISQTGEEIEIHRSYEINGRQINYTLTLFSDKRGEKNLRATDVDETEEKSETFWRKNQLYRYIIYHRNSSENYTYISTDNLIEKYKLSDNGETLTITTQSNSLRSASGFEPSLQESNYSYRSFPTSSKTVFRRADG